MRLEQFHVILWNGNNNDYGADLFKTARIETEGKGEVDKSLHKYITLMDSVVRDSSACCGNSSKCIKYFPLSCCCMCVFACVKPTGHRQTKK